MTDTDDAIERLLHPDHEHDSLGEAGRCVSCRQRWRDFNTGAPHCFALAFYGADGNGYAPHPGGEEATCSCCDKAMAVPAMALPDAVAVVRSWSPVLGDAVDLSWATGCNPGGTVLLMRLVPELFEGSGLPEFELVTGPDAIAAFDALAEMNTDPESKEMGT
jgi:hypothetical protein